LYDKNYPVILLNNSMHKNRQVFTVFHELAHLLFNSGGVDVLSETFSDRFFGEYRQIERKCNQFATELLFPLSVFEAENMAFSEDAVYDLSFRYKVSREVVLRKYLETYQIDADTYHRLTGKWLHEFLAGRREKSQSSGGNYFATQKSYLGDNYINLAFSRYYQGKTNIEGLADYLGMSVKSVPAFETYMLRRQYGN